MVSMPMSLVGWFRFNALSRQYFRLYRAEREKEKRQDRREKNVRTTPTRNEDMDINAMITTYNAVVSDAASERTGNEHRRKKSRVTRDVLDLCDETRDLKKKRYEADGAKDFKKANKRIQNAVKKAKVLSAKR